MARGTVLTLSVYILWRLSSADEAASCNNAEDDVVHANALLQTGPGSVYVDHQRRLQLGHKNGVSLEAEHWWPSVWLSSNQTSKSPLEAAAQIGSTELASALVNPAPTPAPTPCVDTAGWEGIEGANCTAWASVGCINGQPTFGWGGQQFNQPEVHCCLCGKGHHQQANAPHDTASHDAALLHRLQEELDEDQEVLVFMEQEIPSDEDELNEELGENTTGLVQGTAVPSNSSTAEMCRGGMQEDFVYGSDNVDKQRGVICYTEVPATATDFKRPVLIFVEWGINRKMRNLLNHEGQDYVYIRLSYEDTDDVMAAIHWIQSPDNAIKYNVDTEQIVLFGFSRSAVAAMGAATQLGKAGGVIGVVLLNGAVRSIITQDMIDHQKELPKFLVLQGDQDISFLESAKMLVQDLEEMGTSVVFHEIPGVAHADWRIKKDVVYDAIMDFLKDDVTIDSPHHESVYKEGTLQGSGCSKLCVKAYKRCLALVRNGTTDLDYCHKVLTSTLEWQQLFCMDCKLGVELIDDPDLLQRR